MTALAGLWRFDADEPGVGPVEAMLTAQRQYGPQRPAVAVIGAAAIGRGLYPTLSEDRHDVQPLNDSESGWAMVADIRVDNREELLDRIGRPHQSAMSDAELAFRGWLKLGDGLLDQLIGDFAIVLWHARRQELRLIRDPAGQRPLHYHARADMIAFASMPVGLHALLEVPRILDQAQLAAFVADVPRDRAATYFEGVTRVDPGQVITVDRSRLQARRFWQMPTRELRLPNEGSYLEAFREQLDRATGARLRCTGTTVGSHLSAGLDSSAVAATAARLLATSGGRVTAFTSAPRAGFDGHMLWPRIADESDIAAAVATRYGNMDHVVIRSSERSPLDLIGEDAETFQEPIGLPCNTVWWWAVHDEARARGISVMLTGEAGNLTISAGGLSVIAEYVRRGDWRGWWREAHAVAGHGPRWRGVLAASFGPWAPRPLWRLASRLTGRDAGEASLPLLHPEWRTRLTARSAAEGRSDHPPRDNRRARWALIQQRDPGNFRKGILARWGIDERDPTMDRRVAELCLSLPPEMLFSGGVTRRIARLGLADRLPPQLLDAPRGYQYADWYERIDRPALDRAVADMATGEAAHLLDGTELRRMVEQWPTSHQNSPANIGRFRLGFLRALSAGSFANRMAAAPLAIDRPRD